MNGAVVVTCGERSGGGGSGYGGGGGGFCCHGTAFEKEISYVDLRD
jgi:hypothetical protein